MHSIIALCSLLKVLQVGKNIFHQQPAAKGEDIVYSLVNSNCFHCLHNFLLSNIKSKLIGFPVFVYAWCTLALEVRSRISRLNKQHKSCKKLGALRLAVAASPLKK